MSARNPSSQSPLTVVVIGILALAIAMGIGRFAFTPLLPLMLRDGTLSAPSGAEWAAANYLGYLIGALTAPRFARAPQHGLRIGLIGVVVTTLAVAWVDIAPPWVGAILRGSTGIFSAWVLVCASGWCLPELVRRRSTTLGAWIYTGVGLGIAFTGIMAWLGGMQLARALWIELGILAAVGAVYVLRSLSAQAAGPALQGGASTSNVVRSHAARGNFGVILCYSAFGFGYIIPATFLPMMARQLVSDPLVFGLTWPIFGTAAVLSVAIVSRWFATSPRRKVWAVAQAIMGLGSLLPLIQQSLWALAASAVFVGGTFMVTTMAGLQMARERMPDNPTPLLARMTAGFAVGQIAGPILVRVLGSSVIAGWDALAWANAAATVALATSALWLWWGRDTGSPRAA